MRIFNPETSAYREIVAADPGRRLEVVLGDDRDAGAFYPQIKSEHFGNEANFSMRLDDEDAAHATRTERGSDIEWRRGDRAVTFRRVAGPDAGAYDFEVLLTARPPADALAFTLRHKGLRAVFQPPLTASRAARGDAQDEGVAGSYVFWLAGRDGTTPSRDYRNGKAFHFYRPRATDSLGRQAWCDLMIDLVADTMSWTVPAAFLDAVAWARGGSVSIK